MQFDQVAKGGARPAVLFVDDEPQSIKYFSRAFESEFPVLTAGSAAEAEELLASESYRVGVLITDQRMPRQTGVQLLDRVKARFPDIVRLLTTAYSDLDDAVAAVNRGEIFRYILKPWDIETLRSELNSALDLYSHKRYERELLTARRQTIMSLASHIVHELTTPLSAIYTTVDSIKDYVPDLIQTYRRGPESGLPGAIPEPMLELVESTPGMVLSLVERANMLTRMLLMNAAEDAEDRSGYRLFSLHQCIHNSLETYPFRNGERALVTLEGRDFEAFGSDLLLNYVMYNLLKNSLDAIHEARKGEIRIRTEPGENRHCLFFRDTGAGISPGALPHVFEEFYSGKEAGRGTGMGLPFCLRVMNAFGGGIECRSCEGEYTEMELTFPRVADEPNTSHRTGGDKA